VKLDPPVELEAGPGFRLPDIDGRSGGLRASKAVTQRFVTTLFDTEDLRLLRWGATLGYRPSRGWSVRLPAASGREVEFEGAGGVAPPPAAADLVLGLTRGIELAPVFHLQSVRRELSLEGPEDRRGARLVDDEISTLGADDQRPFHRLTLEAADGADPSSIRPVLDRLTDAGAKLAAPVALARALHVPAATRPDVVAPALRPSSTVAEVVASSIGASAARLMQHDGSVRLGEDPEGVHQARVAARRLRSDLRTFRSVLDGDWRDRLRGELRWLCDELGGVRDTDVLGERLRGRVIALPDDDATNARILLDRLRARRDAARAELLSAMREPRYLSLLDGLVDAAAAPRVLDEVAGSSAVEVLGVVMEAPWAHLQKLCDGLAMDARDAELHQARIRAKRVRYAAEALTPVFGKPARRFARRAESLQEVLGTHQDAVMTIEWLRLQSRGMTPRAAFAAGRLAGLEATALDDARALWPEVWTSLRRKSLRFWA
jgi:CHAD domain-containing protein